MILVFFFKKAKKIHTLSFSFYDEGSDTRLKAPDKLMKLTLSPAQFKNSSEDKQVYFLTETFRCLQSLQ